MYMARLKKEGPFALSLQAGGGQNAKNEPGLVCKDASLTLSTLLYMAHVSWTQTKDVKVGTIAKEEGRFARNRTVLQYPTTCTGTYLAVYL